MSELKGKVCLVTGGAGHIGRAICESLLAEGAEVIAVGRREPADPIASEGREATFYSADIRDPAASQALIDFVSDRFGRLDILVNNAGGGPPVAADASAELTQKIISLNLLAPLVLSQQAHPLLTQAPDGGSRQYCKRQRRASFTGHSGLRRGESRFAQRDKVVGDGVGAADTRQCPDCGFGTQRGGC